MKGVDNFSEVFEWGKWNKQQTKALLVWQKKSTSIIIFIFLCMHVGIDSRAPNHTTVIPLLCGSLSIIASFTFIFGLLLGVLLTKCIMKLQTRKKSVPQPVLHMPVYEEVPTQMAMDHAPVNCELEDNVAYGLT